jgi:hypothetical protein
MPLSRISVRQPFATSSTYARLLQVNVEFSSRSRCKEISLQHYKCVLQSRHFAAKWLIGKELT